MKIANILLSSTVLFYACSSDKTAETKAEEKTNTIQNLVLNKAQVEHAGITIGKASFENIGASIVVNGNVEVPPQNKTAITFPYGGFVKQIKVLDGMLVKKGQVLITLEDPEIIQLQQDYLDNLSQLEFLKSDYDRQNELRNQEVNSQKALQLAKSNYFSMVARVKGLKTKLALADVSLVQLEKGNIQREVAVTAPFNGVVTKLNAESGRYAQPQDVLLEIIDLKHCHVEAFVYEKDIPSVKLGQQVHLQLGTDNTDRLATVFLIGKEIGADKTIKVHLHLNKEDEQLVPGTFVKARIDISKQKQVVVPETAIVQYQGKSVVFEQTGSTGAKSSYRMVFIEEIGSEDGKVAIRPVYGKLGEKLVLTGAYSLLSTLTVGDSGE